ncbi:hypothetical protein ACM26L_21655, partial [Kluyvera ascorbata]
MLEINTSKIVNTVTFTVDKSSIAEAKKAADDLQRHFKKLENPKIRFKAQKQRRAKEGANKRGNSSQLTQSFHFFMFEPIFSPVNAL